MMKEINIVGGGLAGSEVALSLAAKGLKVNLFEMRPEKTTEVHETGDLAELVCSNSLKSLEITNGAGLLKEEGRMLGSILLKLAEKHRVPAGKALAVDRKAFSTEVTILIEEDPNLTLVRKEITSLDLSEEKVWVIATGPLSSEGFEEYLVTLFGKHLFFFDAVSPVITADSIDMSKVFVADRYGKGDGDYINCPFTKESYGVFYEALKTAELAPMENFSDKMLFERCQPVEEIARTGIDALRFGPMKPVGLPDPATGKEYYAVLQLRKENKNGSLYSMVGFQTRLKWNEQKKVFRLIPGLERAEFVRYGVMHRNTFLNSPLLLGKDLRSKAFTNLFFCGQITGLEGYVEAIVSGNFVARNIIRSLEGKQASYLPDDTMIGALVNHVTVSGRIPLTPVYANFGLLPEVEGKMKKKDRKLAKASRAIDSMGKFLCGGE